MDKAVAGYVSSCKSGFRPENPDQKGRKYVQTMVIDVPVIIDAIAPSFVVLFQRKAASNAGVIEVP